MTKRPHANSSAGACRHDLPASTGCSDQGQDEPRDCHVQVPVTAWHHGSAARYVDAPSDIGDPAADPQRDRGVDAHGDTGGGTGGLAVLVGGVAAAAGEVALATGVIETVLQDRPSLSIAWGGAAFEAQGYGQQPSEAFAAADTWLEILGADLVMRWSAAESGYDAGNAWAYSEIDYLAIDIARWSPAEPIVIELDHGAARPAPLLDAGVGSYAAVVAGVEAQGADTLSLTSTYAFTESQWSFVQALALALV
jgi:hypothetical protein